MDCHLAPEFGAHVFSLWLHTNPPEVKSVGIPTSTDGRVIAQLTMRMPCAGVLEKFEMLIANVVQYPSKTCCISRTS